MKHCYKLKFYIKVSQMTNDIKICLPVRTVFQRVKIKLGSVIDSKRCIVEFFTSIFFCDEFQAPHLTFRLFASATGHMKPRTRRFSGITLFAPANLRIGLEYNTQFFPHNGVKLGDHCNMSLGVAKNC